MASAVSPEQLKPHLFFLVGKPHSHNLGKMVQFCSLSHYVCLYDTSSFFQIKDTAKRGRSKHGIGEAKATT